MGKRTDEMPSSSSNEEILQDITQDVNPEYVFTGPRSGGVVSQIRKPSHEELREQLYHLSPFLRQWVIFIQFKESYLRLN